MHSYSALAAFLLLIWNGITPFSCVFANSCQSSFVNFMGAGGSGILTTDFWQDSASASICVEGACRQARVDTTLTYRYDEEHAFKVSGEYLTQRTHYPILEASERWLNQYAGGIAYRANWQLAYIDAFELSAYGAKACSKTFPDRRFRLASSDDSVLVGSFYRRITGATSYGARGGFLWQPWLDAEVGAFLNFDCVDYRAKLLHLGTHQGFGVTVSWRQMLLDQLLVELEGALRRPYSYIYGSLNWQPAQQTASMLAWSCGVWGSYVDGRYGVNGQAIVGLQIICWPTIAEDVYWKRKSVAYMPTVMTIADYKVAAIRRPAI
jgi:hypothetical protein